MQLQTSITQLGNSSAVILPVSLMEESKWRRGQKVVIDYIPQADGVFIRRVQKPGTDIKKSEGEFQKWLDGFLREDAALLDELAHR